MKPVISHAKIAITAQLYDGGGDPNKRPFVFYSCLNPATGKLKRIKVYKGFAKCKTLEEIRANGNELVKKINRKLKDGYSPFIKGKRIYKKTEEVAEYSSLKHVVNEPVFNISQYLQQALDSHAPNVDETSLQSYRSQLKYFLKWLKSIGLDKSNIADFDNIQANNFLNHLKSIGRHNTTRNQYRTNLKHLFSILKQAKHIIENPFDETKKLSTYKKSKKPFNLSQQKKLKEFIVNTDSELWLFIQFEYYAFMRPKELRFLRVSDIDLEESKIYVRGSISKNDKTQYVRIEEPLRKMLFKLNIESLPPNFYIFGNNGIPGSIHCSKNYFNKKHREIIIKLGFTSEYSLYSWKHTGAVMAVKAGINLEYLRLQMRHHSLDQLKEYLKDIGVMDEEFMKFKMPEL